MHAAQFLCGPRTWSLDIFFSLGPHPNAYHGPQSRLLPGPTKQGPTGARPTPEGFIPSATAEVGRNSPPASANASAVVGRAIHPRIQSTGASTQPAPQPPRPPSPPPPPCSSPCRLCLFMVPPQETTLSRRQIAGRFLRGIYVASPSFLFSS